MPGKHVLGAVMSWVLAAAAGAAEPKRTFANTPLAGTVSVLQGFENNIVVSVGDDGIVMVDASSGKTASRLQQALLTLSAKPLRFVIDTHVHGDHAGGNEFFQKLAPVISSENARRSLASGNKVTRDEPGAPGALPVITFDGEMTLRLNGEEIRLVKLPPAHTDGDVVVFFKNANVVALGDVYMTPAASFGDRHYGGGMLSLIAALELLIPQIPADAKVVPGHGAISTRADVAHGLEVLKQMKALVELGVREGKTLQQLQADRPFDRFRGSVPAWSSSDKSLDGWVKDFHREISAAAGK